MINQVNNSLPALLSVNQQFPQNMTSEQKKLMKACTDFEAVMVRKLLESMEGSQKMFGSGFGGEFFQGMFLDEMSQKIAGNDGGIGLAKMLYQQLNRPDIINTVK